MEPKDIFKVPPTIIFTKLGNMNNEDIKDISTWIYKDPEGPSPLPFQMYGKGYDIMKEKGYDGTSGLGKNETRIGEPIISSGRPKYLGLGFGLPKIDNQHTNVLSGESMNVFESVETIKDSLTETDSHKWEFGSQRSLSNYFLHEMFCEPNEPSFDE